MLSLRGPFCRAVCAALPLPSRFGEVPGLGTRLWRVTATVFKENHLRGLSMLGCRAATRVPARWPRCRRLLAARAHVGCLAHSASSLCLWWSRQKNLKPAKVKVWVAGAGTLATQSARNW